MEWIAAFQRHFGFKIFHVTANARDGGYVFASAENHRPIFRLHIIRDGAPVIAPAVPNVMDVQIKMVAPEKWREIGCFAGAENISRRSLTLTLCHHPVLDTNSPGA